MGKLPTGTICLQGQTHCLLYQRSRVLPEPIWRYLPLLCFRKYMLRRGVLQSRLYVLL